MFRLEKEMTPIVARWLVDDGFLVRKEMISTYPAIPDLVAYGDGLLFSFELKLKNKLEVLKQAMGSRFYADEVYIAMPHHEAVKVVQSQRWRRYESIGVVSVTPSWCSILRSSLRFSDRSYRPWARSRVIEAFRRGGNNLPKII